MRALRSPISLAGTLILAMIGCAPVAFVSADTTNGGGGASGVGGGGGGLDFDAGPHDSTSMVTSGVTSGGSGGGWTATTGGGGAGGSLKYLCGGSNPMCSPDPGSVDCTQGGNPGMGTDAPDGSTYACLLVSDGSSVQAKCGMAGAVPEGQVCNDDNTCMAGLGCIGASPSICRQYCCDNEESCPSDTYCARATLAGAQSDVPVCTPVTHCQLLQDSTCPMGLTCAIVRKDGTTSCVTPGTGMDHDSCPCAAGYTCSPSDHTCLKLCHPDSTTECGPGGYCQGGVVPYPDGIGYCVPYP